MKAAIVRSIKTDTTTFVNTGQETTTVLDSNADTDGPGPAPAQELETDTDTIVVQVEQETTLAVATDNGVASPRPYIEV